MPQKEHIFPATQLTEMVIRWKAATADGKRDEAMRLLTDILNAMQEMLRRFAHHEGFTRTCDLDVLLGSANSRLMHWLDKWEPSRGRLFSWINTCAKHAWLSEVNRETSYRRRYHVTGDNLEKFFGAEEHAVTTGEAHKATDDRIKEICSRWGSPQEIGALRYILLCLREGATDKDAVARGASYAWALDMSLAKFFYTWCLFELRTQWADKVRVPFTEQDLLRAAHAYTYLPDLLNIISYDQFRKLVAVMGGARLRLPTIQQLAKLKEHYTIHEMIERTDKTPDDIAAVAKARKRSARSAMEIYAEISEVLHEDRTGEYPIFDEDEDEDEDAEPDDTTDSDPHV